MIAVVTGASKGIGRAISLALAERGCDLALLGRDTPALARVASEVGARGRRGLEVSCDVARSEEVSAAAGQVVADLGVPQVVVANAGVVFRGRLAETSEEQWDEVLDVNLKGTFLLARAFTPAMMRQGSGRFVAVGSISGTLGTPGLSAYCASKWGTLGLVKSLAEELRGTGVQALSVLPGSVDTDMLRGSGFAPAMQPEDVARVVVFAALDAPAAMNGSAVEMFGP